MRSATASRAVITRIGTSLRCARRAQDLEPALARQAEIEQHGGVRLGAERGLGGRAVAHPVDREPLLPQPVADALADHRVVLDQEQPHRSASGRASSAACAARRRRRR